jgi:hypothetical protein
MVRKKKIEERRVCASSSSSNEKPGEVNKKGPDAEDVES